MVIRSFFRRKNTKVYLFLNLLILIIILLLVIVINMFNNKVDEIFADSSSFITKTSIDLFDNLDRRDEIINTKRAILFEQSYNNEIISIVSSNYTKLSWDSITNRSLEENIVAYKDSDKSIDLNYGEIAIGLSSLEYINYKYIFDDILNHDITFTFNNEEITFKVSKIYDSKHQGEVVIDDKQFNELISSTDYYLYLSQITNEEIAYAIEKDFIGMKQSGDIVLLVQDYANEDMKILDKSKSYISILKYVCYFIIICFGLFIIIIDRNMLFDLNYNIRLENYFGFKKSKIKRLLIERIISLYLISYIVAFIIDFIIALIMHVSIMNYLLYSLYIMLFILIANSLIILMKRIN